jgi:hypothetical protein
MCTHPEEIRADDVGSWAHEVMTKDLITKQNKVVITGQPEFLGVYGAKNSGLIWTWGR